MLGLKEKKRISHGPKLENFDFYIFSKDQRKSSHTNSLILSPREEAVA